MTMRDGQHQTVLKKLVIIILDQIERGLGMHVKKGQNTLKL